jgi:hypothetical protein
VSHHGTGTHDRAITHTDTPQNGASGTDPYVVTNAHRSLIKIDPTRVPVLDDRSKVLVPKLGIDRMRQAVEDVDLMSDQYTIPDHDTACGPDPSAFAHIAPISDPDLAAMRESEQFATNHASLTDLDTVGTPAEIQHS